MNRYEVFSGPSDDEVRRQISLKDALTYAKLGVESIDIISPFTEDSTYNSLQVEYCTLAVWIRYRRPKLHSLKYSWENPFR